MTSFESLQERAGAWHFARFPAATDYRVLLKLGEECGEAMSGFLAESDERSATGRGNTLDELADVVIAAMVYDSRWGDGALAKRIAAKLTDLETPGSHRASLAYELTPADMHVVGTNALEPR